MSPETEFEIPTWNHIYDMLVNLADKVRKSNFRPNVILGVLRGGWLPARIMLDLMGNSEIASIRVEFYAGVTETKFEPIITEPISMPVDGRKVLVVDDVADSGRSLKLVKENVEKKGAEEAKVATIYYKPWSMIIPDYYEKETRCWVVFPWERKEIMRDIMKRCWKDGTSLETAKEGLVQRGMDSCLMERFLREISEEECE